MKIYLFIVVGLVNLETLFICVGFAFCSVLILKTWDTQLKTCTDCDVVLLYNLAIVVN
jgi:hypothetical protein